MNLSKVTNLFESNYIRMLQRSMIHDFSLNMFINLQYTNLNNEPNTHTQHTK